MHKVDVTKQEDLVGPLKGVDGIVSCLGGQAGIWTPCTLYTDSIAAITGAMRDARVKKLICMSSWGAKGVSLSRICRPIDSFYYSHKYTWDVIERKEEKLGQGENVFTYLLFGRVKDDVNAAAKAEYDGDCW